MRLLTTNQSQIIFRNTKMKRWLLLILSSPVITSLWIYLSEVSAEAAEQVILKYSILRESISVAELRNFADTGELSSSLKAYLTIANKKPEDLRQALTRKVEVDPVLLSKILNSFVGEILLDQVSEVIQTPSRKASRQSLRGALVTSALPDGNIRLIEVLENYPTSEVHVEGDRLAEIYRQLKGVLGNLPRIDLQ